MPDDINWQAVAKIPVVVMYMAIKHLPIIAQRLIKEGRSSQDYVAVIQDATLPSERILESNLININIDIEKNQIKAPAIVVLGPVVGLRSKLIQNVIKDAIN